jgi:hypothetical protein
MYKANSLILDIFVYHIKKQTLCEILYTSHVMVSVNDLHVCKAYTQMELSSISKHVLKYLILNLSNENFLCQTFTTFFCLIGPECQIAS